MDYQTHIKLWESSGVSKVAYCKEHSLTYSTFFYHLKRKKGTKAHKKFIEVKIKDKEQIYFFSNDYHMFNNDLVNEFLSRYKKISISNFKYTLMKYSIGAYIVSNDERKSN